MKAVNQNEEYAKTHRIPFEDNQCLLTYERFEKSIQNRERGWRCPALKFQSYQDGLLTLLNNHENRSYKLTLKVDGDALLISCNCGSREDSLCEHAHSAITTLILMQGERYFKKLLPNNDFDLAFTHPGCFDKKESKYGINVSPRPELKTIFNLSDNSPPFELQGILNLPLPNDEEPGTPNGHIIPFLVLLPVCKNMIPAVLPCVGRLNKDHNNVKTWVNYLLKTKGEYDYLINSRNEELIGHCNELWSLIVEANNNSGSIFINKTIELLTSGFHLWEKMFPLLKRQSFVYAYNFYGVGEIKQRPYKQKAWKITLSDRCPSLKFVLIEKNIFYEFHMQVWLEKEKIDEPQAITPYFILHEDTLYRIPELRDSLVIDWFTDTGGWITVFKEHYDQFAEEIVIPLLGKYPVDMIPANGKSQRINYL